MVQFFDEDLSGTYIRDYLLQDRIGRNRLSERYLARNTLTRESAIALFLRPDANEDAELTQAFQQRTNRLGSLTDPSLPQLIYAKVPEDGRAFALFKYVQGNMLADNLAVWRRQNERPSPVEALSLVRNTAAALAKAHAADLVHYNLTPKHILVTADNKPVLLNLALPYNQPESDAEAPLASQERVSYRSPQQAEGEPPDKESNIFSLGLILYELLVGRQPPRPGPAADFEAEAYLARLNLERFSDTLAPETMQVLQEMLTWPLPPRVATAGALVQALDEALAVEREQAVPVPFLNSTIWEEVKKRWWVAMLVPLLLIGLFQVFDQPSQASEFDETINFETTAVPAVVSTNIPVVEEATSPTVTPTFVPIALLGPSPNSEFSRQSTIDFAWRHPFPLEESYEYILYFTRAGSQQILTIEDTPAADNEYEYEFDPIALGIDSGTYQWQVDLRHVDTVAVIGSSEARSITLLPDATATVTDTPLPTFTPTSTFTPEATATETAVPTNTPLPIPTTRPTDTPVPPTATQPPAPPTSTPQPTSPPPPPPPATSPPQPTATDPPPPPPTSPPQPTNTPQPEPTKTPPRP